MKNNIERHHYMFPAKQHESSNILSEIRSMGRHIEPIYHDEHVELHREIPFVPVMPAYMALQTLKKLREFSKHQDPIRNIENLQTSIEYGSSGERAHYLEKELGELAIYALDLQKDYFRKDIRGL